MRKISFYILFLSIIHSEAIHNEDSARVVAEYVSLNTNNTLTPFQRIKRWQKLEHFAYEKKVDEGLIVGRVEHYLSHDYSRIGDFDRAIEIMTICERYYQKSKNYYNLAWAYNDLAIFYANKGKYDEALNLARKALDLAISNKFQDCIADFHQGVSDYLVRLHRGTEAEIHLAKIDRMIVNEPKLVYDETKGYHYLTKGVYYQNKGMQAEAIQFYKKALGFADNYSRRKSMDIRNNLAILYLNTGHVAEAKNVLLSTLRREGVDTNSNIKETYFIACYNLLASCYLKQNRLDSALYFVRMSENQMAFFQKQYVFDNSKLFHGNYRRENLALGVQISYQLFEKTGDKTYIMQALLFADHAKSNVLNERLQISSLLNNKVTKSIKELRFQWVFQLNEYETTGNTKMAIQLRNSLDSLDQALGLRKEQVFEAQSIKSIQRNMNSGQLVIEYFIHDKSVYIFTISMNNISVTKKAFTAGNSILSFYKMLQDPNSGISDYFKQGMALYTLLVPQASRDYTSVTIIPDGVLYYLPFDALPTSSAGAKSWSGLNYLGKSHTITYDFSLQTVAQKFNYKYTSPYAGFAPRFDNNPTLTYLTNGAALVQQGKDALGGNVYAGKDASSLLLRKSGLHAKVLQLYTHAVSSDSSYNASYIYMADKKMYVDEIMTLPLKNKLCLLTACEVGLGKEYSGEGVTGVAWAFRAAGAQNVVQSLWRINQESSSGIMKSFFEYLADNYSSAEALQKAKLNYIDSKDISERLKHPYYWAGMCHYGAGANIEHKKSRTLWYGLLVFILGATGIFLYKRKSN